MELPIATAERLDTRPTLPANLHHAKALVSTGRYPQYLAHANGIAIKAILSSDGVEGHTVPTAQTKQSVASLNHVVPHGSAGAWLHGRRRTGSPAHCSRIAHPIFPIIALGIKRVLAPREIVRRCRQRVLNTPRGKASNGFGEISWGLSAVVLLGRFALGSQGKQRHYHEPSQDGCSDSDPYFKHGPGARGRACGVRRWCDLPP